MFEFDQILGRRVFPLFLAIFVLLVVPNSHSDEVFITCEEADLVAHTNGTIRCTTWLIAPNSPSDLETLLNELVTFDSDTFGMLLGAMVGFFVTGFCSGLVVTWLKKI